MAYQSFEIEIKNEVAAMSSENKQIFIVQRRSGDFDPYDEDAEPAPPGFYMPQDPILENDEKDVRVFVEAKAKVKTTAAAIGRLLPIVGWGVAFIFLCLIISLVRPLLSFGLEYIAYAYAGGSLWLVLLGSIVLLLAVAFLLVGVFFLFNARGLFVSAEKILKDNFGDLVGLARDFCQLPKMEKPSKHIHIKEDELGETLRNYIKSFPPGEKYVASNGFSDEDAKFVKAFLDSRNDREKHGNSHFWIDEYKQFQLKQDTRAREVVSETCLMIGLKTAACPWKIVDMISVAFNSTIMIARIGRIYNRKTSKVSAFKLFCAFVFNMYVSGELGELFEEGARRVGEEAKKALAGSSMLSDSADNMSSIIVQTVPFLAKFAGKIAEGGVNAFFALRLGNRVIKNFQMLYK